MPAVDRRAGATARWSHPTRRLCCARWIDSIRSRRPPEFAASWAEWLYFNGRTADGRVALLSHVPRRPARRRRDARRPASDCSSIARRRRRRIRRGGWSTKRQVLAAAPDLDIAGNRVRLEGCSYRICAVAAGAQPGTLVARRGARPVAAAGRRFAAPAAGSPATPCRCCRARARRSHRSAAIR